MARTMTCNMDSAVCVCVCADETTPPSVIQQGIAALQALAPDAPPPPPPTPAPAGGATPATPGGPARR